MGRGRTYGWILFAAAALPIAAPSPAPRGATQGAATPGSGDTFLLAQAFYGPSGYTNPAVDQELRAGNLNSFAFWPPVDSGMERFLLARPQASAIITLAGASRVEGLTAESIERQRQSAARLRRSGLNVYWNLMEEWDQSGGRWVAPRRQSYAGRTRRQAHDAFVGFYLDRSPPLGRYLREPASERGCPLVAQTDFAVNAFYAFEMGADVVLLERGLDELADLSTGIAFVRGAARQFDRGWGIDLSVYRTSNQSPTTFDPAGKLTGGWSASYLRRHLYVSFLSGARMLQLEPAILHDPNGRPNPLGHAIQEFAEFALRRHPDAGAPIVSTAIMTDYDSGFDPRHWVHCQAKAVWYRDIPYSDGDHMLDNFLQVAYPDHWLHGLAPGAPFADSGHRPDLAGFKEYLKSGRDPRPYEPKGPTRWGDNLDFIGDNASLAALRNYRVIALVGDAAPDWATRRALRTWVEAGGTLVVNTRQVTAADEPLLGVRLGAPGAKADRSRWLDDGAEYAEPPFTFRKVTPLGATVLATAGSADPLVTRNALGRGEVVLTTADYLQSSAKDQLLKVGVRLFDWLDERVAPARIVGAPIEYIVGRAPGKTLVTLVNNSPTSWTGTIALRSPPATISVREYLADVDVEHARSNGQALVTAAVPAWDLKVFAFEER